LPRNDVLAVSIAILPVPGGRQRGPLLHGPGRFAAARSEPALLFVGCLQRFDLARKSRMNPFGCASPA